MLLGHERNEYQERSEQPQRVPIVFLPLLPWEILLKYTPDLPPSLISPTPGQPQFPMSTAYLLKKCTQIRMVYESVLFWL